MAGTSHRSHGRSAVHSGGNIPPASELLNDHAQSQACSHLHEIVSMRTRDLIRTIRRPLADFGQLRLDRSASSTATCRASDSPTTGLGRTLGGIRDDARHSLRGTAPSGCSCLVTVVMGGWAAWMTGRAMAHHLAAVLAAACVYSLILAGAVRFIHFALFEGTLPVAALLHRRRGRRAGDRAPRLPLHARAADGDASIAGSTSAPARSPGANEAGSAKRG